MGLIYVHVTTFYRLPIYATNIYNTNYTTLHLLLTFKFFLIHKLLKCQLYCVHSNIVVYIGYKLILLHALLEK